MEEKAPSFGVISSEFSDVHRATIAAARLTDSTCRRAG